MLLMCATASQTGICSEISTDQHPPVEGKSNVPRQAQDEHFPGTSLGTSLGRAPLSALSAFCVALHCLAPKESD